MWTVILIATLIQVIASNPEERNFGNERVIDNILQNYQEPQILVRPAQNTTVDVGLTLTYIKYLHKGNGRLTAGFMFKQSWVDSRLTWQDTAVPTIRLPSNKLWKPDLKQFNSVGYRDNVDNSVACVVYQNGTVIFIPTAELTTTCVANDDDAWDCSFKIGSWSNNAFQLPLSFMMDESKVDMSFYKPDLYGFDVEAPKSEIITKDDYECCQGDPYSHVNFRISLRVIGGGVASGMSVMLSSGLTMILSFTLSRMF